MALSSIGVSSSVSKVSPQASSAVTLAAPRGTRFRPCFHSLVCGACAGILQRRGDRCPICRETVRGYDVGAFAATYAAGEPGAAAPAAGAPHAGAAASSNPALAAALQAVAGLDDADVQAAVRQVEENRARERALQTAMAAASSFQHPPTPPESLSGSDAFDSDIDDSDLDSDIDDSDL